VQKGVFDPTVDPGHTFIFLVGPDNTLTNIVSIGPIEPIGYTPSGELTPATPRFLNGDLPATAEHKLQGPISTYTWKITPSMKSYKQCMDTFNNVKANPGNYTIKHHCTSAAIDLGTLCGLTLPSGASQTAVSGTPEPNPYGLQTQLNQTKKPTIIPSTQFTIGQKINITVGP
jgi:hypothetical protein